MKEMDNLEVELVDGGTILVDIATGLGHLLGSATNMANSVGDTGNPMLGAMMYGA